MSKNRVSEVWQWGVIITAIVISLLAEFRGVAGELTPAPQHIEKVQSLLK